MSFEIRFSPQAEETFEAVIIQLEQRWGDKYVSDFKNKVYKSLDIIVTNPFIYPVAPENSELRKCVIHKNTSVYYSIKDEFVEIHYFWDNRQEPLSF